MTHAPQPLTEEELAHLAFVFETEESENARKLIAAIAALRGRLAASRSTTAGSGPLTVQEWRPALEATEERSQSSASAQSLDQLVQRLAFDIRRVCEQLDDGADRR